MFGRSIADPNQAGVVNVFFKFESARNNMREICTNPSEHASISTAAARRTRASPSGFLRLLAERSLPVVHRGRVLALSSRHRSANSLLSVPGRGLQRLSCGLETWKRLLRGVSQRGGLHGAALLQLRTRGNCRVCWSSEGALRPYSSCSRSMQVCASRQARQRRPARCSRCDSFEFGVRFKTQAAARGVQISCRGPATQHLMHGRCSGSL